jgi:hypothetical protein
MYSLGVLLACLTSWLLLRALRAERCRELWWSAYALAVTAFCYTHYYAFFTILAQTMFVVGDLLVRGRRLGFRTVASPAAGFIYAGSVSLVLYSPWLPILRDQVQAVHQSYWIRSVTPLEIGKVLISWGTGAAYPGILEARLWLLLLLGCVAWLILRADRAGWLFLLQAAVPWLLSLGISRYSDRPIFVERYLVFAQVSLLGFWGVVWCRLPWLTSRLLLVCFLGMLSIFGLRAALSKIPEQPPALVEAAEFLKEHYQPSDVILVSGPTAVNLLRYYAKEAGLPRPQVKCQVSPFSNGGHQTHVASLNSEDVYWDESELTAMGIRRVWQASDYPWNTPGLQSGMKFVLRRKFSGGGNTSYTLTLFDLAD